MHALVLHASSDLVNAASMDAGMTELDLVANGGNGYFIRQEEPVETWTERVSTILGDTALREEMGRESKRIIEEEFNSGIMIQRILDAIDYSLSRSTPASS